MKARSHLPPRRSRLAISLCGLALAALRLGPVWASQEEPPPDSQVWEFHLVAQPAKWEIAEGIVVDAWAYNGQVPGPEIRAREGDWLRVTLTNSLPVPTTIHWHGIDVPNYMDGVPGLTQPPVMPGESFTYQFRATNPGTRWYHSHQDSNFQLELGLYGPIIIEPKEPDPNGPFDVDYTVTLDEKALDFTPDVALGKTVLPNSRGGLPQFDLFLINGKAGSAIPPISISEGQRLRLRLVNVGHLVHSMHLHGHSFRLIATDGNPVPPAAQFLKDTVTIGPGERYDLEVLANNPGHWMFHCHMPNHQDNGMMTTLVYSDTEPPFQAGTPHASTPSQQPAPQSAPNPQPAGRPSISSGTEIVILDNRYDSTVLTVPVGTTVTWRNKGLNLHTSTSFDGIWDSQALPPGASFSYTFAQAGVFRYYCRQHLLQGQLGTIIVQ